MLKILAITLTLVAAPGLAASPSRDAPFVNIDGGTLSLADYRGQAVLVVNTASQCAFTRQYSALQTLWETYRDRGLVVLAVPSDDFAQELDSAAEVKEFCEVNYNLTLPMTDITHVRGSDAHPFYAWLAEQVGFVPRWNFNKVLIGPDGAVLATFGSPQGPLGPKMIQQIEQALP
ncbi:glutathione peroxidase [Oceaniglobus ichthyenteri]|uniref:glutathione peroxidase n=1 Tax=Oceaniglobus ichthyenteri TaxID=2136177 RepID=UPI001F0B9EE6|nr:glutathione peroxidase [Oceaniglobus ichthyenteri]